MPRIRRLYRGAFERSHDRLDGLRRRAHVESGDPSSPGPESALPRHVLLLLIVLGLILLTPLTLYAFLVLGTRRSAYYHYGA